MKIGSIKTLTILSSLFLLILSSSTFLDDNKPGRNYVQKLLTNNKKDFGFSSGNFIVSDNGSANYQIPLMTPPGTAGMSPKLSIAYNSQSGNGLLGDGWNLNGLSVISRASATMSQDGFIDGVDFDGNDKLMLDGQRLVLTEGQNESDYGSNLAEYRTEQNSFRKIVSYGGGEPEEFIVHSKEGLIYYYGHREEANSRVLASGVKDKIFYWLVDRIEDRNGNYILINYEVYQEDSEYRPKSIVYTGNDKTGLKPYNLIEFNYKTRSDVQTRYIGGSKSALSRILVNISTYYSENIADSKENLVREYKFEYNSTSISKKNILTTFTECTGSGGNKKCLNPTKFEYLKETEISFNEIKKNNYNQNYTEDFKTFYGDLNKDGLPDKLLIKSSSSNLIIDYYLNQGEGVFPSSPIRSNLPIPTTEDANIALKDSDADGDADISISYFKNKKWYTTFLESVIKSDNSIEFKKTLSKTVTINNDFKKSINIVDLNGDALSDAVLHYFNENKEIVVHKLIQQNSDFHISDSETLKNQNIPENQPMFITDLNNDGFVDFLFTWTNKNGWFTKTYLNESEKLGALDVNYNNSGLQGSNREYQDENDRRIDVIDVQEGEARDEPDSDTPSDDDSDNPNLNIGNASITVSESAYSVIARGNYGGLTNITFADFNSDNNPDLILSSTKNNVWKVFLVKGLGNGEFGKPEIKEILKIPNSSPNYFKYDWNFLTGEFNGDGLMDVMIYNSTSKGLVTHFGQGASNSMFIYKEGLNESVDFSYNEGVDIKTLFCDDIRKYYRNRSVHDQLAVSLGLTRAQFAQYSDEKKFLELAKKQFDNKGLVFPTGFYPDRKVPPLTGHLTVCKAEEIKKHLENNIKRKPNHKRLEGMTSVSKNECPTRTDSNGRQIPTNCAFEGTAYLRFSNFWKFYSTDLNGDGINDLVFTYPIQPKSRINPNSLEGNHKDFIWINKSTKSGLLNKVEEGNSSEVEIEYLPLTDSRVYDVQKDFKYPLLTVRAPIYNVSRTLSSNGIKDGKSLVVYKYFDGISSLNGRGFLGFRKVYKYHKDSKIHDWKAYFTNEIKIDGSDNSEYVEKGIKLLKFSKKYYGNQGSEVLIEEVNNTPSIKYLDATKKSFLPYVKSAEEKKYDYKTGSLLAHRESNFEYDINGNLEFTQVDHKKNNEIFFTEITKNEYDDNQDKWLLGRLSKTSVIKTDLTNTDTSVVEFEYDGETGQLNEEKFISDNTLKQLVKTYEFDDYGNVTKSHLKGFVDISEEQIRTTSTIYDKKGRFVLETEDALGYKIRKEQNQLYGYTSSEIDVNGNETKFYFDDFGNQTKTTNAIGNWHENYLKECISCDYPKASHFKVDLLKLGSPTITYYDIFSRVIAVETFDYKGRKIVSQQEYDSLGQIVYKTPPYFEGEEKQFIEYKYDELGRLVESSYPNGKIEKVEYKGLDIHKIDALNRETIEKKNSLGQLIEIVKNSTEDIDDRVSYEYDLRGNIIEIIDHHGANSVLQGFDKNNNRISVQNPNLESPFKTDYNAFGEVIKETSPSGNVTLYAYDKLGRLIKRNDPNGATVNWGFINYNSGKYGKGQLQYIKTKGPYVFRENFEYDEYGRIVTHKYARSGKNYNYKYQYDNETGLLNQEIIPSTFEEVVTNRIYKDGTLVEVKNNDGDIYWQLKETDHLKQITSFELGNGVQNSVVFEYNSNNLTNLEYTNADNTLLDYSYDYDYLDNVVYKKDEVNQLEENFSYDVKDRLIQSQVKSGQRLETIDIAYDRWNNIKTKSKDGSVTYDYVYSTSFPSRLDSINGKKIAYDNEGNRKNGLDYHVSYNHFNKPNRIIKGNTVIYNQYGPNGDKQLEITQHKKYKRTKYLIGGLLETTYEDKGFLARNKLVHERVYIVINGQKIVHLDFTKEKKKPISKKIRYNHFDLHGSLVMSTDEEGKIKSLKNYDAWGLERSSSTWLHFEKPKVEAVQKKSPDRFPFSIGFQSHEMIASIGLIDMGGRFYDPVLSQFLSIDPIVSIGSNLGMNGYAYVLNNPLKYLDPSGYLFKKLFKGFGSILSGIGDALGNVMREIGSFLDKNIVTIAVIAVAFYTGGVGVTLLANVGVSSSVAFAAGFGFGAAFSGAIFSGASFGEALQAGITAGIISGMAAAFTGAIGDYYKGETLSAGQTIAKAASHGTVQGTFQMMQGGKFEHGFASGMFTEFTSPVINKIGENGFSFKRVATAGIIGGTASSLGGGKFSNGAVSGAMVQAFNHESERETWDKKTNDRIKTLDPDYQDDFKGFINDAEMAGQKLRISDAYRSNAQQKILYDDPSIRAAPPGASLHNYGRAIDVVVYKYTPPLQNPVYCQTCPVSIGTAAIGESRGLHWGGYWKKPDQPHFSVPIPYRYK